MPLRPLALVLALLAAGCGASEAPEEPRIVGDALTVYSSLPHTGALAPLSRDLVRAEKLALEEAGGRAGEFRISFVSLDSSDPETGRWSPDRVAENARTAVEDLQTIAYLGELEPGASTISLPILNEGGMLQLSPGDTFAGLTAPAAPAGPDRYYPSGRRTFVRLVPDDGEQAVALARLLQRRGARRVVLADDRRVAGIALADALARELRSRGTAEVAARQSLDPEREVPDDAAREVRELGADAFVYTGGHGRSAGELLRAVATGAPRAQLVAGDAVAAAPGLAARAGNRLLLTAIAPERGAAAAEFRRRFRARYGDDPHPRAVLGYRALRLVLEAVRRAGPDADSRPEVIRRALALAGTAPVRFAVFRLRNQRLVWAAPAL